jgi:hypothetical protein
MNPAETEPTELRKFFVFAFCCRDHEHRVALEHPEPDQSLCCPICGQRPCWVAALGILKSARTPPLFTRMLQAGEGIADIRSGGRGKH